MTSIPLFPEHPHEDLAGHKKCSGCDFYFDDEDIDANGECPMCRPLTPEQNEQARQESQWEIDNDR